ncbi:MAG: hypothetical protein HC803_03020 [Saprospiraceae bacterium]|nr:hypothetical protein [Saprospiraceae bacterium]
MKYCLLLIFITFSILLSAQQPRLILQKGHTAPITDIAISEDGRLIASASFDGTILLWDALSKKELAIFEMGNEGSMGQLQVEFKDDFLVGFGAGKVNTWHVETAQMIGEVEGNVSAVEIDGQDNLILGYEDGRMNSNVPMDLVEFIVSETVYSDWIEDIKVSNDGKYFLTASADGLFLWDKNTATIIDTLTEQAVSTANFSFDSEYIVAGGSDGVVRVFRAATGAFINAFELHENRLIYTDISRDNGTIISTDIYGKIAVWDTQLNDTICTIEMGKGVRSVKLHPDGRTLFVGYQNKLRLYRTTTGKQITDFGGLIDNWKNKFINNVDFDKNNSQFITSENGVVRFWGEAAGDKIVLKNNVVKAIFHPEGRFLRPTKVMEV